VKKLWKTACAVVLASELLLVPFSQVHAAVPTFTQNGGEVHYNWGTGGPPGVPTDNFEAIFTQPKTLPAGDYFVQTVADDGVKVEVDGQAVIDRLNRYTTQPDHAILPNVTAGAHTVKTSYREVGGAASVFSDMVPFNKWVAYYYTGENLSGMPIAAKTLDKSAQDGLSEDNGLSSPVPGVVGTDHFSARYVTAKRMPAGQYTLHAGADDGIRVYVDGQKVLDHWGNYAYNEQTVNVNIADKAGDAATKDVHWIEVEYFEASGSSRVTAYFTPVNNLSKAYKTADMHKVNGEKQIDYINSYDTYYEAVQAATNSGANAILNNDQVVWINNGFAYANDVTINIYSSPGSSDTLTYVARATELKVEAVEGDWVKVRLADTIGYVRKSEVVLVPGTVADSSYFTVKNGDLYYYISHNGWYDVQLYGKAPSFLTPGVKYYSVNGHEFNGQEAYQYFQYLSAHTKTNYTAEELNWYVSQVKPDSPLKDLGAAFKKAEADYNVNAMMLLAIAIHESNYGLNRYSRDYHNIFSINATDRNTSENAFTYPTYEACIEEMAKNYMGLGMRYSNPLDWRYEGAYLGDKSTGMNVRYASDAYWGSGIASVMYQIDKKLGGKDWAKYSIVKPNADTLNVRPTASTSLAALYQVNNSMVLTKLADQNGWFQIISDVSTSAKGAVGEPAAYVSGQYVRTLPIVR
jgi:beta-N-acetylglucosaminidase